MWVLRRALSAPAIIHAQTCSYAWRNSRMWQHRSRRCAAAARRAPKGPCVLEFFATWCGPCRQTVPHLSEIAKRYQGRVAVIGVSMDEDIEVRSLTCAPCLDARPRTMNPCTVPACAVGPTLHPPPRS